jgi:hypothetical protein
VRDEAKIAGWISALLQYADQYLHRRLGRAILISENKKEKKCKYSRRCEHQNKCRLHFQLVISHLHTFLAMFKKRTRPVNARVKESTADDAGPSNHSPLHDPPHETADEPESDLTTEIDELILLRKLRKSKQGIDLARFNRGEKKAAKDDLGAGSGSYGLHANVKKRNDDDEPE